MQFKQAWFFHNCLITELGTFNYTWNVRKKNPPKIKMTSIFEEEYKTLYWITIILVSSGIWIISICDNFLFKTSIHMIFTEFIIWITVLIWRIFSATKTKALELFTYSSSSIWIWFWIFRICFSENEKYLTC